ncbi:MAG TPA: hypothetical protein VGB94_03825 [Acidobacteriaceae bacterium]
MKMLGLFAVLCIGALAGCGGQPVPSSGCAASLSIEVKPYPAAPSTPPDHTLIAPGNQEQFLAYEGLTAPAGCAVPALVKYVSPVWTSSDNVNIQLSPSNNGTVPSEVATCLGTTPVPVTITGTVTDSGVTTTGTSTMTCK